MSFMMIESTENKTIKYIAKLKRKKYREEYGEFIIEGIRAVMDTIASFADVKYVVMSQSFYQEKDIKWLDVEKHPTLLVTDKIFQGLSDTQSPQGILCVAKIPKVREDAKHPYYIYCDNIQDPGNIGTIIRTADALGFGGVLLSETTVSAYNPKTIRSTMGSLFHVDIHAECTVQTLKDFQERGYQIVVTALSPQSNSLYHLHCTDKMIVVVGNEGSGVSQEIMRIADTLIQIPMYGKAESLNVSVAAALLMNEVARNGWSHEK